MGASPNFVKGRSYSTAYWRGLFAGKADDPIANPAYVYLQPRSGDAVVPGVYNVILDPVADLDNLTVVLPLGFVDGQIFEMGTTRLIGTLTAVPSSPQELVCGGPAELGGNGGAAWRFLAGSATWFPVRGLGAALSFELREDSGMELREDSGIEERE